MTFIYSLRESIINQFYIKAYSLCLDVQQTSSKNISSSASDNEENDSSLVELDRKITLATEGFTTNVSRVGIKR
jgi:hypothetical protein